MCENEKRRCIRASQENFADSVSELSLILLILQKMFHILDEESRSDEEHNMDASSQSRIQVYVDRTNPSRSYSDTDRKCNFCYMSTIVDNNCN